MLPQSTVALRMSKNYSKVAHADYLKWSKSRIVLLSSFLPWFLSFFFSQPSTLMWEATQRKQPSIVRIFPRMVLLCLVWSNYSLKFDLSNKDAQVYVEHLPMISQQCATMLDAIFVEYVYLPTQLQWPLCVGRTNQKRTETSLHKKISIKRDLADVEMAQWMHALIGWQSTETRGAIHICTP